MTPILQRSCSVLLFLSLGTEGGLLAQSLSLSGKVTDAANGEALPAATVRIAGTPNGTICNTNGTYRFSLPAGSYRVAFSFIGYKSDTVEVDLRSSKEVFVSLVPAAIQMAEVVVTGEDPAIAIMRKVIENKHRWMERLEAYRFEAFTRQILRRDTAIAQIAESYSTGYWQKGDTLREVIKQRRQTGNVKAAQNFASVGGVVNFYDDEIRFSGYGFVGPTSPDAFANYDFKLERTRQLNGVDVFDIKVNPRSRIKPLFVGRLSIIDEQFALVGIDVTPNEAFIMPFIPDLKISYSQQFRKFEERFWMPVDVRINGVFKVRIAGLTIPAIGFEGTSSIYDYQINPLLPDTIKIMPRRVIGIEAQKFDTVFWQQREVLPLTTEEQTAYLKLDSTETLDKQFKPSGPLATLADGMETGILEHVDLRYNRAEGLYLGGKADFDSVAHWLSVAARAGYGFADQRGKWSGGGEIFLDTKRRYSFGASAFDDIAWLTDGNRHTTFNISLAALISKDDYRDYYRKQGWEFHVKARPSRHLSALLEVRNEDHRSVPKTTDFSIFYRGRAFRTQPAIDEGTVRSIGGTIRVGGENVFYGIIPVDYGEVTIECSSPSILPTAFSYTRTAINAEYHIPTMLTGLFLPPKLSLFVSAGISGGTLPTQKYFTLDSRYVGFAPTGTLRGAGVKEFGGDRYASITLEHNFRSTPFLALNIPFLYKNSIELLTYWSAARAWAHGMPAVLEMKPTDGWYQETGIGISRIFGLLRLDVTYRLTAPAGFSFTLGIASLI